MSSHKRLVTEFQTLEDANAPTKVAKAHGILSGISPMKGKYYEARIADEGSSKTLVGFHPQQCEKLVQFKNIPIMLDNCSNMKSKYSEDLEVVVNKSTIIAASPKKLSDH